MRFLAFFCWIHGNGTPCATIQKAFFFGGKFLVYHRKQEVDERFYSILIIFIGNTNQVLFAVPEFVATSPVRYLLPLFSIK